MAHPDLRGWPERVKLAKVTVRATPVHGWVRLTRGHSRGCSPGPIEQSPPDERGPILRDDPLLRTALDAADAAAAVHLEWSGRVGMAGADAKGRSDFVSGADLESQETALELIRSRHPDHLILAEEGDPDTDAVTGAGDTPIWVVDPLDGTTNFLHRHPMYASSVAVAVRGRPVAGAVACAPTGERWWAARGEGAWKNGRRIRTSSIDRIEDALVGTGFPFKVDHLMEGYADQLTAVLRAGAGVRRGGAAALDLCYTAEGRFDVFWELFLNPWDFAAGVLVVEEAGGVVTDLHGEELSLVPGGVMAGNGTGLLGRLRDILEEAGDAEG